MIQTVTVAQELYSKASLVDHKQLAAAQKQSDLVRAESLLQDAFATDVRPAIQEWRASKGLPQNPMQAFRESGYLERITAERSARNAQTITSYA
jgi:L-rhamnose isomerase/sugar isomerase